MTALAKVTVLFTTAVLSLVLFSTAVETKSFVGQNVLSLIGRGYVGTFRFLVSRGVTVYTLVSLRRRVVRLVHSLFRSMLMFARWWRIFVRRCGHWITLCPFL